VSEQLIAAIRRVHPVPREHLAPVLAAALPRRFEPGQHLVSLAQPAPNVFFLVTGLVRMYLLRRDGREFNKAFHREGEFTGSHAAAVTGQPSLVGIVALEPVVATQIPFAALEAAAQRHVEVERLLRRLAELRFWHRERREAELLLDNAHERFERLRRNEPWLLARVSQKQLASYLGITEVSLSRLRSRRLAPKA